MKLRGDDPGAMKDFILGIQNSVNQLKSHSAGQEDGKAEIHSKRVSSFVYCTYSRSITCQLSFLVWCLV